MNGPDWLKVTDFNYTELKMPEACQTELRKEQQSKTHGLLTIAGTTASIGKVIEIERFSTFHRLVSVTAKVLRICQLLLHSVQSTMTMSATVELSEAEALSVIESKHVLVQHKNFNQWKRQFDLFKDEFGGVVAEFTMVTCPTQPESLPVHITCQKCPQATISQRHEINNDRATHVQVCHQLSLSP